MTGGLAAYRRRWRRRRRRRFGRRGGPGIVTAVAAGLVLAAAAHAGTARQPAGHPPGGGTVTGAATRAIAYARAQLGEPYQWGGTGPGAWDCSGLVMMAWRAAGIGIPRTSQQQWALLPHVPASRVRPGDLVFFPGADGTWSAPGHVALVISRTRMIQAYATGYPVEVSPLTGAGAGGIVGYADPRALR